MRKLKLDIDPKYDLDPIIDHWCRECQKVHEFWLHIHARAYRSQGNGACRERVTFLQLSIEGRLIESKWRGIARNRPPRTQDDLED